MHCRLRCIFYCFCTTAGGRLEYNYPHDMKQPPTPTNHNISHFYCWSIVSKKINKIQNHVDLDLDCTNKMFQFGIDLYKSDSMSPDIP